MYSFASHNLRSALSPRNTAGTNGDAAGNVGDTAGDVGDVGATTGTTNGGDS